MTDAIGSTEGFTFELRPAKTSVPQTKLAGGMAQPSGGSVMFDNRTQAGRLLVEPLVQMKLRRPLVLALPRGGVPLAVEVATALAAELDLLVVRKIGVPAKPELAAGAIVDADPPELVFNDAVMAKEDLDEDDLAPIIERERQELHRRRTVYRRHRTFPALTGRSVVLVDDGAATGTTMLAAIRAVRRRAPGHLIVALPVADRQTVDLFLREGVETVCLEMPERLRAVGLHYRSFEQLDDRTVLDLLDHSPRRPVD